jgi:BolA protein
MNEALPITAEAIRQALLTHLAAEPLEVTDESASHAGHAGANDVGWGTHFRVRLHSPQFIGQSRVAQHRLVYKALQTFVDAGLHALAIEISPPPR